MQRSSAKLRKAEELAEERHHAMVNNMGLALSMV
jgi:hypothetical protein